MTKKGMMIEAKTPIIMKEINNPKQPVQQGRMDLRPSDLFHISHTKYTRSIRFFIEPLSISLSLPQIAPRVIDGK